LNIGSWSAEPEAEDYVGDDLFIYINGGAEIYHEYGFGQVSVRRYERGEERVSVEIYTMAESAFGIYSFSRSQGGRQLELGDGATIADYYLHLWADRDMAVITAETEFEDGREAVEEIARAVAECLAVGGEVPALLSETASHAAADAGAIYVRGQLALVNVARPVAALFAGFQEGVVRAAADHTGATAQTVHLAWPNDTMAEEALETARQRAREAEGATVHEIGEPGLDVSLKGQRIQAARNGRILEIHVKPESSSG
jgi:hypothetical protein